jgi:hypothetical protein|nr:MAG TPA: hypothetical protein [Caudoviricetes sp.]
MDNYKFYRKDNYIVLSNVFTDETFYGFVKEVQVDKSNLNKPHYRFFNIKDWNSDIPLRITQLLKEDGNPYGQAEFETFYSQNTGNFNGGGSAPGVQSVTGVGVDNADPKNPVITGAGEANLQTVLNTGTFATFDGGQNTIRLMDGVGVGKEINFITSITADESYSQFQQTTDQILFKNGVGVGNDEGSFSIIGANPVLERRVDLGGGQTGVIQLMFDGDTTEGTKLYSLPNDKVAKPNGIPYTLATLDDISVGGNQNLQDVIDKGSVMQKTNGNNYFSMAFTHTPSNDVITSIDQYWEDVSENSFRAYFQQNNGKLALGQQEGLKASTFRFKEGFDGSNTIYEIPTKPNKFELDGTTPIPYILVTVEDLAVDNPTTSVLSASILDSTYPNAVNGFRVHCVSIVGGALNYEKTDTGWIQYLVTTVV